MKKIKYFFILSSILLSFDAFSVDWVQLHFSENIKRIKKQVVMSDLEEVVTDYVKREYGQDLKHKETVNKLELWSNEVEWIYKKIELSIDDIYLTTESQHAINIKDMLERAIDSYSKGNLTSPHYKILESSDGSKKCIKLNLFDLQLTATKEFFEILLKELQCYN